MCREKKSEKSQTLGLLLRVERVSTQMQPEPWNQMTSWWKGSRTSETLLTDRQLSFLSWVWEFQRDICVTKQIQPSSHHGKATVSLEIQIANCSLAAIGASTLTILQAFFSFLWWRQITLAGTSHPDILTVFLSSNPSLLITCILVLKTPFLQILYP